MIFKQSSVSVVVDSKFKKIKLNVELNDVLKSFRLRPHFICVRFNACVYDEIKKKQKIKKNKKNVRNLSKDYLNNVFK